MGETHSPIFFESQREVPQTEHLLTMPSNLHITIVSYQFDQEIGYWLCYIRETKLGKREKRGENWDALNNKTKPEWSLNRFADTWGREVCGTDVNTRFSYANFAQWLSPDDDGSQQKLTESDRGVCYRRNIRTVSCLHHSSNKHESKHPWEQTAVNHTSSWHHPRTVLPRKINQTKLELNHTLRHPTRASKSNIRASNEWLRCIVFSEVIALTTL